MKPVRGSLAMFPTAMWLNPTPIRGIKNTVLYDRKCVVEGQSVDGGRVLVSITEDGQLLTYKNGYLNLRIKR